ncbi:hypothetical protein E4631_12530 [Hymenobacter sp. UV11]|uniref:hypothetical protein n=1 Tax=Hymenobacter sp. UV11 TaxID=1849735 RepID=UPI00105EDF4D|nr:hypothetical protein [Hymenobacter sp. UV11]TDN38995.1 hypothetical protein A8B98_21075 [Hymenobacter sp. UV11]TFZ65922.1 hypothetical protein E4631_12530 [Hymenobacter sp. UV11]
MNPSTPPKGSLEDLFRHHLLESEAAAVPPRPQVWEQLDNSLLLAQNEQYRRRLRVHRWAIAASLLLASLAGSGWWHSQQPQSPTLATATPVAQPAEVPGLAAARRAVATPGLAAAPTTAAISRSSYSTTPTPAAIDQTTTLRAKAQPTDFYAVATGRAATSRYPAQPANRQVASTQPAREVAAWQQQEEDATTGTYAGQLGMAGRTSRSVAAATQATTPAGGLQRGSLPPTSSAEAGVLALATEVSATAPVALDEQTLAAVAGTSTATLATQELAMNSLSAHTVGLDAPGAALPASLSPVAVTMPPVELARHWQYGISYAASAFHPNIDFTKAATSYNSFLGANSASLTTSAAAEYRNNLHAGLGQRLGVWASRRLGGSRWRLRTGLELAQNTATSATSMSFVGEQVASLTYAQAMRPQLQRTSYRYRSASAAAEMRYASPLKTGFSLYGRVGALLTALLNVRSDVDGTPEATRTYNLLSTTSPYRPLTASLRGGGGIQYRPVGHQWALNLGPVADFGILSLNADPSQDFWHQQRPYSFGLEAGLELGRPFRLQ